MFRFANIEFLYALIAIPVLVIGYVLITRHKRRQLRAFGDPALVSQLMPNASQARPIVKFSILMVALTLLIIAAARPQHGVTEKTEEQRGIEAVVALDISNSMLAEDVAPNRLDRAKQMVSKLVDNMSNDRVGLVVFAGESFVQLPITSDYASAKMFLSSITPELIRMQGTAIGEALNRSIACFDPEVDDISRVILIITDGENHEDDALAAAQRAAEAGIQVIVIGIGKPEGTTIPVPGTFSVMKDKEGNPVVTKLNEEMCQQIAESGQGFYVHCDNTNTAQRIIQKHLDELKTTTFDGVSYKDYNEQFVSFALIALLLLIIDFFIFNRKNKLLTKMDVFGEKTLMLAVLLACSTTAFAQKESRDIRSGNSAYRDSLYDAAEVHYRRALETNSDSYAAQFNVGNALYRQNDSAKYEAALKAYQRAAYLMDNEHKDDPVKYAKAMYNAGNCYKQLNRIPEAIESYSEALRKNPKDDEARENLAKLLQMQQQQQNQQNQQQQQEQQEEEQQEEEQQEQQEQMSQETAEQLLQALEQEDKRPQPQGQKRPLEKNW